MHLSVPVSVVLLLGATLPAAAFPAERAYSVIARRAPSTKFVEIEQRSPQWGLLFKGVEKVRSLAIIVKSGVE